MATDRELRKQQEAGQLVSAGLTTPSTARSTAEKMHRRARDFLKTGTENAATNVAEAHCWTYFVNAKARELAITVPSNVANDTSDYVIFTFRVRDANGANGQTLGVWNTHTSADGQLTAGIPAYVNLRTNADAEVDDGEQITYQIQKIGSGKAVPTLTTFEVWAEEM